MVEPDEKEEQSGAAGAAVAPGPREQRKHKHGANRRMQAKGKPARPAMTDAPSGRFFEIYKRGQGRNVRMGTVLGAAIIVLAGMNYLWNQLGVLDETETWTIYVRAGIPLLFLLVCGGLVFWFAGSNRKACDFLIATEGEMKKVSWSSRREVIGSTKVVIFFSILIAALLFVVDMVFIVFFASIGVLKGQPQILRRFLSVFGFGE